MGEPSREKAVVCVVSVGFHHFRGPEVEHVYPEEFKLPKEWNLLPFYALPDGSHQSDHEFAYFTLPAQENGHMTSFFGISCVRQLPITALKNAPPPDVTRSYIQKAVVVVLRAPLYGILKEKLGIACGTYFEQADFSQLDILNDFYMNIKNLNASDTSNYYLGLPLARFVQRWESKVITMLKLILLKKKILVYGKGADAVGTLQFCLVSLIPGLMQHFEDAASPEIEICQTKLAKSTSLKTSDRNSLLAYMGLPLILFGKGSFFAPYAPLQQLPMLQSPLTSSWLAGTTNQLLIQKQSKLADAIINLETCSVEILSNGNLCSAASPTWADKRWISELLSIVHKPEMDAESVNYVGNDDWLRAQFETYILGFLSTVRFYEFMEGSTPLQRSMYHYLPSDDCFDDYGRPFLDAWKQTTCYQLWNAVTDHDIFDVIEPKHPCQTSRVYNVGTRLARFAHTLSTTFAANIKQTTSPFLYRRVSTQEDDNGEGQGSNETSSGPEGPSTSSSN
ncbi:LAlv9 family protein [Schizosaccharomyces japonicus yFS275]|uniref:LAlv9 family protein n=1 Tax=Schizosaccharomyces japonicus (strain yFS275 / FY16936) TaxID=402676 RepID=B6K2H5_SCHJY|nr:LAlv9 family protein [Schizosaccharomyces japonicus yFS275]EEB07356.1 LAlv9 family protein [Schizosaccharomyces japonicus yFS275]